MKGDVAVMREGRRLLAWVRLGDVGVGVHCGGGGIGCGFWGFGGR